MLENHIKTPEIYDKAKKNPQLKEALSFVCLAKYLPQECSIKYLENKNFTRGKVCYWFGEATWTYCRICKDPVTTEPLYLYSYPHTGGNAGRLCFSHAHNEDALGLGRKDTGFLCGSQKIWTPFKNLQHKEHATCTLQC